MIERESFSAEDGHIESIVIGVDQIKVSFQTWDARQMVLLFEGAEKITSSNSVYCDIGRFQVEKQDNNLLKYIFYDVCDDNNGKQRVCLTIEAKGLKIYEAGRSKDINSALFDVGKDFMGNQSHDKPF